MPIKKATWIHKLPQDKSSIRDIARRLAQAGFDMVLPCVKQVAGMVGAQSPGDAGRLRRPVLALGGRSPRQPYDRGAIHPPCAGG